MCKLAFILSFLYCFILLEMRAQAQPHSAVRGQNESYFLTQDRISSGTATQSDLRAVLVLDRRTSLDRIDILSVPQAPNDKVVSEMFTRIRDTRSWVWYQMDSFPRRLSWLYPEDGCFLRAELMVSKLKEWGYMKPKQIFAFGDLSLSTPYEKVNWWYHVAPVVRVGLKTFVIDPAIDYYRPLEIQEWVKRISTHLESNQFALCEAGATSPDDICDSFESTWELQDKEQTLQAYLGSEWANLELILGASPEKILGNVPPWKSR